MSTATGTQEKTRAEWVREAVAHERAARWSEARHARAAAMAAPGRPAVKTAATDGPALEPGTVLKHMRWGKVEAECTYVAPGDFRVAGASYPSITAATCAASGVEAGRKGAKPNWRRYWGLDKQVQDDPRGFDQTKNDVDLDEDAEIEASEPEFTAAFAGADSEDDEAGE